MEAIQHSLLGPLLVAPLGLILLFSSALASEPFGKDWVTPATVGVIAAIVVVTTFTGWLLGAVARPAYGERTLPDGERRPLTNGFDVWELVPEGGLRPPRFLRVLVTAIGGAPSGRPPWAAGAFVLLIGLSSTTLLYGSAGLMAGLHPWLSPVEHRRLLFLVLVALYFLIAIRQWATAQRTRLAPRED